MLRSVLLAFVGVIALVVIYFLVFLAI